MQTNEKKTAEKPYVTVAERMRDIIASSETGIPAMSRQSGISPSTIRAWLNGCCTPNVEAAEWLLYTLGYEIRIERIDTHDREGDVLYGDQP